MPGPHQVASVLVLPECREGCHSSGEVDRQGVPYPPGSGGFFTHQVKRDRTTTAEVPRAALVPPLPKPTLASIS